MITTLSQLTATSVERHVHDVERDARYRREHDEPEYDDPRSPRPWVGEPMQPIAERPSGEQHQGHAEPERDAYIGHGPGRDPEGEHEETTNHREPSVDGHRNP